MQTSVASYLAQRSSVPFKYWTCRCASQHHAHSAAHSAFTWAVVLNPLLQPTDIVPHVEVTPNRKIKLLNYFITNFAMVMNRNLNIYVFDGLRQPLLP